MREREGKRRPLIFVAITQLYSSTLNFSRLWFSLSPAPAEFAQIKSAAAAVATSGYFLFVFWIVSLGIVVAFCNSTAEMCFILFLLGNSPKLWNYLGHIFVCLARNAISCGQYSESEGCSCNLLLNVVRWWGFLMAHSLFKLGGKWWWNMGFWSEKNLDWALEVESFDLVNFRMSSTEWRVVPRFVLLLACLLFCTVIIFFCWWNIYDGCNVVLSA